MITASKKLAIAQITTDPGDIENNKKKIIRYIEEAKKNRADIVIFPELAIPGYMSLDLILNQKFVLDNLKALQTICKYTNDILVILGFIDQDYRVIGTDGAPKKYNSAAIIYNSKILAIIDKTLLPNYDVFFENRYFSEGRGRKLVNYQGIKIGIEICEDLWDENYPIKVSKDLANKGADILINISGSPFYIGKRLDREKLIKKVSQNFSVPFIYVNTVGSQDGYDGELVFDGQSMVFNNKGRLVKLGKEFQEQLLFFETNELYSDGRQINFRHQEPMEELFKALTLGVKDYFRRTGFKEAFIGLSGGIDSAVTLALAVSALGNKNVVALAMPSPYSSESSIKDSVLLANNLKVDLQIISITSIFTQFLSNLKQQFKNLPPDATEENLQARIRGMLLMAHANKFNGLVISTANKTEVALGYSTLYGDMCGAIAPLADVSKLKVFELAKYINKIAEKDVIPISIIKKVPSAELKNNQTDEKSLGASYKLISPLVDEIIEKGKSSKQLNKKYSKKLVEKIANLINRSEHKRRQASPGIKVTTKAFGLGRRIPITHRFKF